MSRPDIVSSSLAFASMLRHRTRRDESDADSFRRHLSFVVIRTEKAVSTNNSTKITEAVVAIFLDLRRKPSGPHQFVVDGQVRSSSAALLGSGDVLPATVRQKTMIRSGNQTSVVFESDSASRLDDAPMGQNLSLDVATISANSLRAVNPVTNFQLGDRPGCTVRHQHRRVTTDAVDAAVRAASIRIDGLTEPDIGRVVAGDDRARLLRLNR